MLICVESINGNAFKTVIMQQKVQNNLNVLHQQGKLPRDQVPMEPDLCGRHLVGRFADDYEAEMVLNADCFALYKAASSAQKPSNK
jgi:hypothetical protein